MNKILNKNQYDAYGYFHGYWEEYYFNGNLWYKGNYSNGLRNCYWEYYWLNGNLCYKGNYINGKPHGYWEWYNDDGKKESECYFL